MSDLLKAMTASAAGMRAQGVRMRVVAENIANANSLAQEPGMDPYRRKIVTFGSELDKAMNIDTVVADGLSFDQSDFGSRFEPGNPVADERGYVATPNVNTLIEMMDMRQAQRSYESNLNAMESSRRMAAKTLELLQ